MPRSQNIDTINQRTKCTEGETVFLTMGCRQSKAARGISANANETKQETAKESRRDVKNGSDAKQAVDSTAHVLRHAWIIIWIDDKKVGKIVMSLKGKGVTKAVSDFQSLYTGAVLDPNNLCINETDPKFFIVSRASKGLDNKGDIYGIVQEGNEVIDAIRIAKEGEKVYIKQAHLFPVKITKP